MSSDHERDFEKEEIYSGIEDINDTVASDESLGSDLLNIKDTCENFFNIDKDNVSEDSIPIKIRIKKPGLGRHTHSSSSYPDLSHIRREPELYQRPQTQFNPNVEEKTPFEYLKEEAEKESERMKRIVFEKNSFSSDAVNVKKLRELKKCRKRNQNKIDKMDDDLNNYAKEVDYYIPQAKNKLKKRDYKKKSECKDIKVFEPISTEIERNIESFADFSDSMFNHKVRDQIKVFQCANADCNVELPSLSRIKRHYLVHTNIKPFKCLSAKCTKRFSRKDNMLQHYRTHCKDKRNKD